LSARFSGALTSCSRGLRWSAASGRRRRPRMTAHDGSAPPPFGSQNRTASRQRAGLAVFRPDISQAGTNRISVMGRRRSSQPPSYGRCRCRLLLSVPVRSQAVAWGLGVPGWFAEPERPARTDGSVRLHGHPTGPVRSIIRHNEANETTGSQTGSSARVGIVRGPGSGRSSGNGEFRSCSRLWS